MPSSPTMLITGAAGFLGRHLVLELLGKDSLLAPGSLLGCDRKPMPADLAALQDDRLNWVQIDITDAQALEQVIRGVDIVFHLAAVIDWGGLPPDEVMNINLGGTEKVIAACRASGVKILLGASSLDAVYDGADHLNADEDLPYPSRFPSVYCESKALSEQALLAADGNGLATCALRPADVYGPGDPYHLDALVSVAKSGIYFRVGDGSSLCQQVYVGNMAHAFAQVAQAMWTGNHTPRGKAYFITDGPARNFFRFFDTILEGSGYALRPRDAWIPKWVMMPIGALSDAFTGLLRPFVRMQPKVSRFSVHYICHTFTFQSDQAKRDFGFQPKYSLDQALERTIAHYSAERKA